MELAFPHAMTGSGVVSAALELFAQRHYSVVAAVCENALKSDPRDLDLRLIRARALSAMGQDEAASAELRECLELDRGCAPAYRLLGEISLRANRPETAAIYLEEVLRIDSTDSSAGDLLNVVRHLTAPLPAPEPTPVPAVLLPVGSINADLDTIEVAPDSPLIIDEVPTSQATDDGDLTVAESPTDFTLTPPWQAKFERRSDTPRPAEPVTDPFATAIERPDPRSKRVAVGTCSEPGETTLFGEYLVLIGFLSPAQLQAALDYHQMSGARVGAAAVALGFASSPRIEWAALAFHSQQRPD